MYVHIHIYIPGINRAISSGFLRRSGAASPPASCPEARRQALQCSTGHNCRSSSQKPWLLSNLPDNVLENQQCFQWKLVNDLTKIYQNHGTEEQTSVSQLDHTSQEDHEVWLFIPSFFLPTRALLDVSFPFGSLIKIPDFFVLDILLKHHLL